MDSRWRLLTSDPADGASNMALDQAILAAVAEGAAPPTLRLYAWDPPCVSLGHAQPEEVLDLQALHGLGWDAVRRPTGGRALLHTDEITYAVIAPETDPAVTGGVVAAYRRLSRGLVEAFRRLGLQVDPPAAGHETNDPGEDPLCFVVPSAYEITVRGKKLVGSAQLRRRGAVLQHGAVPLTGDLARLALALRFPRPEAREEAARTLRQRATTLEEALGRSIPWSEAAAAIAAGFASALGWDLHAGELSPMEAATAERLTSRAANLSPAASTPAGTR